MNHSKNSAIKRKQDDDTADTPYNIKRCKKIINTRQSVVKYKNNDDDQEYLVKRKQEDDKKHSVNISNICNLFSHKTLKYDGSAIIYTRVSTGKQTLGTSLSSQQMICKEYCKKKNFKIINEYSESVSAKNMCNQTELQKIVEENNNIKLVFRCIKINTKYV